MFYRLSPAFPHCLTTWIWNGKRKKQFPVNLSYIKARLICKNSQLFFSGVSWLSVYLAAFQRPRIDVILHSRVAEKKHHTIDYLHSFWNWFYCHRMNDLLRLVITHNFYWIFVLAIFWPHDQFNGFLLRLLLQTMLSTSTRDCGVTTFLSEGETSDDSSFTKLANSSSSWSNTWTWRRSFWKPHFWKQLIHHCLTWNLLHADFVHEIAFKTST